MFCPGKNLREFAPLPFSMKLFVPFATSDNGVYVSEEKRAEVVLGERAKVLARLQHESCASGWRLPRANRFSRHDVNYYTSPRYPRYPPPLLRPRPRFRATRVNFFLRSASKKSARKRPVILFPFKRDFYLSPLPIFFYFSSDFSPSCWHGQRLISEYITLYISYNTGLSLGSYYQNCMYA